jgi:hypothetical protein
MDGTNHTNKRRGMCTSLIFQNMSEETFSSRRSGSSGELGPPWRHRSEV